MSNHDDMADIAMNSVGKLKQTRLDDDQALALVEIMVKMINATTAPTQKQLGLMRADIQRLEKEIRRVENGVRRVETDLRKIIDRNCGINNLVMGFGFVGIIVAIIL